jgi:hypothetical protein
MNKTIQLYIFGITSFDSDIFDKFCTGKTEVDNIYNLLVPIEGMSTDIAYFTLDLKREED